ncbi:MAG: hypothetical protein WCA46_12235 [Actinocatenispora sp.]
MAERVYLHVGAPKTGTTYLQRVLWENKKRLQQVGYTLPGTRAAHYQAMGDLRRGLWFDPASPWTWDRLVAEVRACEGTVIISEEMLGAATLEQAERAVRSLHPADVHIVVAGRDLWRTIPSSWQQAVRARAVGTFAAYLATLRSGGNKAFWDHQTPLPILQRWGAHVPPERRHLITVPPRGADPTLLWSRFADALDIPAGVCRSELSPGNVSLGAAETELLRRVNVAIGDRYPLRNPYLRVVRDNLVSPVLMARARDAAFGAPVEMGEWVAATAKQMVEDLREYPCHISGSLDDLIPVGMAASVAPDDIEDTALLAVAVETIVGMLAHTDAVRRGVARTGPGVVPAVRSGVSRRLGQAARRLGVFDAVRRLGLVDTARRLRRDDPADRQA